MAQVAADSVAKLVTVLIQNTSPTTIVVSNFMLLGSAVWVPGYAPVPGQSFSINAPTFQTSVSDPYALLGASVNLVPSDGGLLTISWIWQPNQPLQPGVSSYGSNLALTCWTINGSTTSPTVTFAIKPS